MTIGLSVHCHENREFRILTGLDGKHCENNRHAQ